MRRHGSLALYLGTIAAYADMYLTQPLLPLLSQEFGVGCAAAVGVGLLANAFLCGRASRIERPATSQGPHPGP